MYRALSKYWLILLFGAVFFLLWFQKLFWLAMGLSIFLIFYKIGQYLISLIYSASIQKVMAPILFLSFIFFAGIGIRLFVLDVYRVPSESMENALLPEDVILVNKLIYGPKLPSSPFEIPWINLLFNLNERARNKMNERWWSYRRLPGTSDIKQGDIVVFQINKSFYMVKRCVALPGDTLKLSFGEVYTNSRKFTSPLTVKNKYLIKTTDKKKLQKSLYSMDLIGSTNIEVNTTEHLEGEFSVEEYDKINTFTTVISMTRLADAGKEKSPFVIFKDSTWNSDDMGPFVTPQKGMEMELNAYNYKVYKDLINKYENVKFTRRNNKYTIDGEQVTKYRFKQNYFFVLGDNRINSSDSRHFGFMPESTIVGKATRILFSNSRKKFHWDRFIKKTI